MAALPIVYTELFNVSREVFTLGDYIHITFSTLNRINFRDIRQRDGQYLLIYLYINCWVFNAYK